MEITTFAIATGFLLYGGFNLAMCMHIARLNERISRLESSAHFHAENGDAVSTINPDPIGAQLPAVYVGKDHEHPYDPECLCNRCNKIRALVS